MALPFFTIGHPTRQIGEFIDLLTASQVGLVVDVRTIPRSRTNPQYNREALPELLSGSQIAYEHIAELGGRRPRVRDIPPNVNGFGGCQRRPKNPSPRRQEPVVEHSAVVGETLEAAFGLPTQFEPRLTKYGGNKLLVLRSPLRRDSAQSQRVIRRNGDEDRTRRLSRKGQSGSRASSARQPDRQSRRRGLIRRLVMRARLKAKEK